MTPQEFNKIKSISHRANIVWDCSRHIEERVIANEYIIKIYELYGFYVEVWINAKSLKIEKINALENKIDWHDYLQTVSLHNLYQ